MPLSANTLAFSFSVRINLHCFISKIEGLGLYNHLQSEKNKILVFNKMCTTYHYNTKNNSTNLDPKLC